jgi:hypothetical protein
MPYGYSGPALAVGALSSAVGDYFKKQLESEMALPQLQQTMEALNQMKLAGLQRQAMMPMQLAGMQQGLQKGQQQLAFLPEQQALQRAQGEREAEQFGHLKNVQWPYEANIMARKQAAMQDLQKRIQANGGQPLQPKDMNSWIMEWGDALAGTPMAQHYKPWDPALEAQRLANARRYASWADWLDKGRPGMGGNAQNAADRNFQSAITAARRQAESNVSMRLNEFKGVPNAELGNFQDRQDAIDWMIDNEYRNILQQRGLTQGMNFLPPQKPMPPKLRDLMNQNSPATEGGTTGVLGGISNIAGRAYNWLMNPTEKPQPQQAPTGPKPPAFNVPQTAPVPWGPPVPQIQMPRLGNPPREAEGEEE